MFTKNQMVFGYVLMYTTFPAPRRSEEVLSPQVCGLSWAAAVGHRYGTETHSYQFTLVAQSCLTICDFMDCSMQDSLSINNSWILLKLISIKSGMPPNQLIL